MSGDGVEGYVQISSSSAFRELHAASIARQQTLLPTHEYRRDILYLVQTSRVLVLVGHTGSGKTTRKKELARRAPANSAARDSALP